MQKEDEFFMRQALKQAKEALDIEEVPVGAVVVCNGKIIARACNLTEQLNDSTAHAEMQAFTIASANTGGKYLQDCTLYVTLEPCPMCCGACYWTQIGRVVYGAADKRNLWHLSKEEKQTLYHPKTIVEGGILEKECSELITDFFKNRR